MDNVNSTEVQTRIADLFKKLGVAAKLSDSTGKTKATTYVVIDKQDKKEKDMVVVNQMHVTMPGNVSKAPVVSDKLTIGKTTYLVIDVELEQPANIPLTYKLVIT